ncbi:hypothetical protein ACFX2G_022176 [Malus domestica]
MVVSSSRLLLCSEQEPIDLSVSHLCFATLPPCRPSLSITCLAVNHNLFYPASGHEKCLWISTALSLMIWQDSDLRCVESVKAHEDVVNALAVLNDGMMYTGSTNCQIWVWSKPFGEEREDGSGVRFGLGGSSFEFGAGWDLGWVVLVLSLGKTERGEERVRGRKVEGGTGGKGLRDACGCPERE